MGARRSVDAETCQSEFKVVLFGPEFFLCRRLLNGADREFKFKNLEVEGS